MNGMEFTDFRQNTATAVLHPREMFELMLYAARLVFPPKFYAKKIHLFPAIFLLQFVRHYNKTYQAMQAKYRLVPLPKRFYAILTSKEYLKCDHYTFMPENVYDDFVKSKEANWLNLNFVDKAVLATPSPNEPAIVKTMLKKPVQSILVPVLPIAASSIAIEPNCIYVSENCYQNAVIKYKLNNEADESVYVQLQAIQTAQLVPQLANKATVFIINQPHEIANDLIDDILGCYFAQPRILYRNYTYQIDLDETTLGNHLYAKHFHIFSSLRNLYFRCVHLESKDNPFELSAVVVKSLTSLQQTTSINMAVPKQQLHELCCGIKPYPGGLLRYFEALKASILPFMPSRAAVPSVSSLSALPLFLLQGERGAGKTTILNAVAHDLGLQIYGVDCVEVVSQIPSQTEAKIKIVLNKANICEPLIICLYNFEIFGLDNEGREDLRIITMFQAEIQMLFAKERQFPIIVVGVCSEKETKPLIQRLFLETIRVDPLGKDERFETLKWLHTVEMVTEAVYSNKLESVPLCSLAGGSEYLAPFNEIQDIFKLVADKTPGFLYGDLRLLYDNSRRHMQFKRLHQLTLETFETNLVAMQSSFSDSLGAPKVPKVLWSDIGGLAKLKDEIQTSIGLPLKHMHLMGKNLRRSGILLYGPPGTGKTLVAKAVATECNLSFLSVQGPELLNMYVGQSEQNVREVFARARSAAPCVIFLDELDSLAPNRGAAGDSGGVMDRVVSQLMTEMNGMVSDSDPQKQIFILAATNRPDLIDPSLLRPGRFDKLLYVGPCTTTDEKIAVLDAQMKRFTLDKSLTKKAIADMLKEDMTGADLYSICSNAWLSAVRRTIINHLKGSIKVADLQPENVIVNNADFQLAAENFVPSVSQKDMEYFNKLKTSFSV